MRKILSVALFLMLSVALYAQKDVTKFLGIPVDGSKASMIQKLKGKGFVYNNLFKCLEGEFNGENVEVYVVTDNNKVRRIAVADKSTRDEAQIKIRYNTLCRQFANNPRYKEVYVDELPDSKDISYEMTVNNKEFQACYAQLPDDGNLMKRQVWFCINRRLGEYSISIYYDNVFNEANGEDL
ncbi:MAG: hypothetical protein K6A82_08740 [Prevotella sp.]|nr:hypothetical protein [Prevotella sp.]